MLNQDAPEDPAGSKPSRMRICTICDGFDAILRMSAWLVRLPADAERTDLSLAEATEHLGLPGDPGYSQILIAPDTGKAVAPKLVTAVLQLAAGRHTDLVILLPPGARLKLPPLPRLQVRYGPPFALPEDGLPDFTIGVGGAGPAPLPDTGPVAPPQGPKHLIGRMLHPSSWRRQARPPPPGQKAAQLPAGPCRVLALQPAAGGAGSTTIAVNLAVEMSRRPDPPEVCLIDLNLQFGNVNTYLDLPASSRVTDAYRQLATLDFDSFQSCLQRAGDQLRVFAAPSEILPVDGITDRDLRRILTLARESADLVLLDLPHLVTDWSGTAWAEADLVFTICRADVRSAQNMSRLTALLQAERLADGRRFHLLNAVPSRPDTAWKAARDEFEKGLGSAFLLQLPDGGEEVSAACNSGAALWRAAPASPFRGQLLRLAEMLAPQIQPRHLPVGQGNP